MTHIDPTTIAAPAIGEAFEGGFFGGLYFPERRPTAIIVSSKIEGDFSGVWLKNPKDVPGATSLISGMANTVAMAKAGSPIAKKVLGLTIGGKDDWFIPAIDQQTVLRSTLFPRAGITPAQTIAEAFQGGGEQALEQDIYWSSTQYAAAFAWLQRFTNGRQYYYVKGCEFRVRAVREIPL
jgi:hypothetical protein